MTLPRRILDGEKSELANKLVRSAHADSPTAEQRRRGVARARAAAAAVAIAATATGAATATASKAASVTFVALAKTIAGSLVGGALLSLGAYSVWRVGTPASATSVALPAHVTASASGGHSPNAVLVESSSQPTVATAPIPPSAPIPLPAPSAQAAQPFIATIAHIPTSPIATQPSSSALVAIHGQSAALPSPASSARSNDGDSLTRELASIDEARHALRRSDTTATLAALDRHRMAFPNGAFAAEAMVLRIEALSRSGRTAEARELSSRFLAQSPNSPYARRLRSLVTPSDALNDKSLPKQP